MRVPEPQDPEPQDEDRRQDPELQGEGPRQDEDLRLSFDELVIKYERKIYNLIYRQLGDAEDAADLTQDTFVRAYNAYGRFRGDSKVYTWLCQIALNACKNRFRQRDRQKPHLGPSLDEPFGDEESDSRLREIPDVSSEPGLLFERQELRRMVERAIDSLPPDYKGVILLRDVQGLTYHEIAEATGLTLEAVKTRLHRARLMLRRKLEPYLNA
ncbi:MAG: sigma-70 family RNA polymerase sigma factor [Armatimonadetes bacterium]|nr:sigma-70 family RNA polymerase sigma factor [Armatimonadota bacterium]